MAMRTQVLVQLSDELIAVLDQMAVSMEKSRSELIREAVESYMAESVQSEIDRRIVDAYSQRPADDIWAEANARELIRAEPW